MQILSKEECWYWAGSQKSSGYGIIKVEDRYEPAHRVIYEALVGEIPESLEPDHLCENPICINPEHIEPVTHAENIKRHFKRNYAEVCRNGHPKSKYTSWVKDKRSPTGKSFQCRECHRINREARRERILQESEGKNG